MEKVKRISLSVSPSLSLSLPFSLFLPVSLSASRCCSVAGISTWSTTTTTADESSASTHLNGTKPNLNKLKPKAKLGRNSGETQGTQGTRHKAQGDCKQRREAAQKLSTTATKWTTVDATRQRNSVTFCSGRWVKDWECACYVCVCVPCTCMGSLYMCLCVCVCLVWQLPLAFTQQTNCLQFGRCFWGNLISSPSLLPLPSSRHVPFVAFVIVEQLCSLTCHKRCSKCC